MNTRNPLLFVLFIAILFGATNSNAQESRFSDNKFITPQNDTLHYRLLYPDAGAMKKYPLVIFLHGSGERGSDNEAQLKWGVLSFATDIAMMQFPSYVLAPQCPANQRWANIDSIVHMQPVPNKPLELVIKLVKQFIATQPIDTNRIYITGISMGGYGTYDFIERYPNLFAAAVPVCGAGDVSKAPLVAHIPMWIFHGESDPLVKSQLSLNMYQALVKAGGHPGLTVYPNVGHYAWLGAYSDNLMMEWLFKQRK